MGIQIATTLVVVRVVLLLVLVCLLASVLVSCKRQPLSERGGVFSPGGRGTYGGASRKARSLESKNLVVDTLNLTHWLQRRSSLKKVELCDILSAIEETAPILRSAYPGRVIYVTKDRETRADKADADRRRALYQATARRAGVYINVVERLPELHEGVSSLIRAKASVAEKDRGSKSHASLGRDDFYLIMLAWKYNCPVLSRDRFHDLADMKHDLESFHVYGYSPVKNLPERDFVNPAAAEFLRMRRPATVDYPAVLPRM